MKQLLLPLFMSYLLVSWLKVTSFGIGLLAAHQPTQSPALGDVKVYVSKVDSDKTLTLFRYMQTYGHPLNPGKDTLFWAYSTDFPGSVIIYYSGGKIIKIQETARTSVLFCENNYYFKNNKLLFVKERQVNCSLPKQRAIWFKNALVCNGERDCFFSGSYYFANDSCIAQQEHGDRRWEPHRANTSGRSFLGEFFPWQAARYVAVFGHPTKRH